jgi:hypothetical protein
LAAADTTVRVDGKAMTQAKAGDIYPPNVAPAKDGVKVFHFSTEPGTRVYIPEDWLTSAAVLASAFRQSVLRQVLGQYPGVVAVPQLATSQVTWQQVAIGGGVVIVAVGLTAACILGGCEALLAGATAYASAIAAAATVEYVLAA